MSASHSSHARLGVLTKHLGRRSETFIQRHILDLADTPVVVSRWGHVADPDWRHEGPLMVLEPSTLAGTALSLTRRVVSLLSGNPRARLLLGPRVRRAICEFLCSRQVDVVLAEYLDPWVDLPSALHDVGIRMFVHGHGYDMSERLSDPRWGELYANRYANVNGIIVPSAYARSRLREVGVPEERIHVIPYGVELSSEAPHARHDGPLRVLAVGRLVSKKAPLLSLRAVRDALEQGAELKLDIVGDGPLAPDLAAAVETWGLDSKVRLLGSLPHDEVLALMERADVFVQHSVEGPEGDEEGVPVAILEAMAHGAAVVSTRHAGIPEAVIGGRTGLLVDEHDVTGMCRALVQLSKDRDLMLEMARAAQDRIRTEFSWQVERERLSNLLGLEHADS